MGRCVGVSVDGLVQLEDLEKTLLEQFQQKWEPVLRPELRLNKEIEHFR